ncbi:MAG: hypothetical protein ABEJ98_05225 [Candidatus Nanohaloarchaea archaeon]
MNLFTKFKESLKKYFGLSIPEWHSIAIGAASAIIGGPALFGGILGTALGVKKGFGHLYDLKKELGYGLASFSILEYGPHAVKILAGVVHGGL